MRIRRYTAIQMKELSSSSNLPQMILSTLCHARPSPTYRQGWRLHSDHRVTTLRQSLRGQRFQTLWRRMLDLLLGRRRDTIDGDTGKNKEMPGIDMAIPYLGQVGPFQGSLSGPSLFFQKHCLPKNTIKKAARKHFRGYYLGQVGHFYVATNLAQITPPKWYFFALFLLKCAELPIFKVFLNINRILAKHWPPKKITFHIWENTAY